MKTINFEDLYFTDNDIYSSGTYGNIKKCLFDGKTYACKEFKDPFYLVGKRRLIEELSDIQHESLYTPEFWVKKDGETNRYLTDFCTGKNIDACSDYPINKKVKILKDTKNLILSMHGEGIIHADLLGSNIMIENSSSCIIDFDNASYKNHKTCIYDVCDLSQAFIKAYGIKKEIDIFIFNILTFSIINECEFYLCRKNVFLNNLGYFNNSDSKKICDSFFLDAKAPNKDFLIDTIDDTSFTP